MEIPKKAKRVFKGVIFDVYQWRQKMYDGTYQTFEAIDRPNTADVIAVMNGKIIISEQEQPDKPSSFLSLFGGRQEKGESPMGTVKREMLEESGLESDYWEQLFVAEMGYKLAWKGYVYIAHNCKKVAEPKLDSGEKITSLAVDFDEFIEIVTKEDFRGKHVHNYVLKLKASGKLDELRRRIFKR